MRQLAKFHREKGGKRKWKANCERKIKEVWVVRRHMTMGGAFRQESIACLSLSFILCSWQVPLALLGFQYAKLQNPVAPSTVASFVIAPSDDKSRLRRIIKCPAVIIWSRLCPCCKELPVSFNNYCWISWQAANGDDRRDDSRDLQS